MGLEMVFFEMLGLLRQRNTGYSYYLDKDIVKIIGTLQNLIDGLRNSAEMLIEDGVK
jgi:hypothetical protein